MTNPFPAATRPVSRIPSELIDTAELAARLRCDRRTVERLVQRGILHPLRLGRVMRFDYPEVVEALRARPRPSRSGANRRLQ